jgi:DNA-directed RNA polymerase subunit RPC12/RpoP
MVLKGCVRCHGDVYVDEDLISGRELVCLQCGDRMPERPLVQLPYVENPSLIKR